MFNQKYFLTQIGAAKRIDIPNVQNARAATVTAYNSSFIYPSTQSTERA
jgi:hypothetical protein